MRKTTKVILLLIVVALMSACGRIETENVGVRTSWDKEVQMTEIGQGFYTAVTSSVEEFSAREITIPLANMRPKAGDNLTLQDLDLEVYYTTNPSSIAEIKVKYANRNFLDPDTGVWYAGYELVRSMARSVTYSEVGKMDSLIIHKNRTMLAAAIQEKLQSALNDDDPGVFDVKKVIIRNATTDPSIEESIKAAVRKNKELEAAQIDIEVKAAIAEANNKLTKSLSPEILRQKELEAMVDACGTGSTCIIDFTGGNLTPLIQTK